MDVWILKAGILTKSRCS